MSRIQRSGAVHTLVDVAHTVADDVILGGPVPVDGGDVWGTVSPARPSRLIDMSVDAAADVVRQLGTSIDSWPRSLLSPHESGMTDRPSGGVGRGNSGGGGGGGGGGLDDMSTISGGPMDASLPTIVHGVGTGFRGGSSGAGR